MTPISRRFHSSFPFYDPALAEKAARGGQRPVCVEIRALSEEQRNYYPAAKGAISVEVNSSHIGKVSVTEETLYV